MTTYDQRFHDTLSEDDEAFLKNLEDGRGLFTQMGDALRGPMMMWNVLVFVFIFAFMALGIWFALQVSAATDLKATVLWMFGIAGCVFAIAMLKIWFFMRMNHIATLRELKKIELRLARLSRPGEESAG